MKVIEAAPRGASLYRISALSCRQMAWDNPASAEDAIEQLKIKAARLQASAIVNVQCDAAMAATVSPNCWQSVVCRAEAVTADQASSLK